MTGLLDDVAWRKAHTRVLQTDRIICPKCERVQDADVTHTEGDPWPAYVHVCEGCAYIILEGEWEEERERQPLAKVETAFNTSHYASVTHCERCGVERTDWERDRQIFPLCWHCDQEFAAECQEDAAHEAAIDKAIEAESIAQKGGGE